MTEDAEPEWQGWTHWLNQELAKTPDDEMLLFMQEMMNYKPEFDNLRRTK